MYEHTKLKRFKFSTDVVCVYALFWGRNNGGECRQHTYASIYVNCINTKTVT